MAGLETEAGNIANAGIGIATGNPLQAASGIAGIGSDISGIHKDFDRMLQSNLAISDRTRQAALQKYQAEAKRWQDELGHDTKSDGSYTTIIRSMDSLFLPPPQGQGIIAVISDEDSLSGMPRISGFKDFELLTDQEKEALSETLHMDMDDPNAAKQYAELTTFYQTINNNAMQLAEKYAVADMLSTITQLGAASVHSRATREGENVTADMYGSAVDALDADRDFFQHLDDPGMVLKRTVLLPFTGTYALISSGLSGPIGNARTQTVELEGMQELNELTAYLEGILADPNGTIPADLAEQFPILQEIIGQDRSFESYYNELFNHHLTDAYGEVTARQIYNSYGIPSSNIGPDGPNDPDNIIFGENFFADLGTAFFGERRQRDVYRAISEDAGKGEQEAMKFMVDIIRHDAEVASKEIGALFNTENFSLTDDEYKHISMLTDDQAAGFLIGQLVGQDYYNGGDSHSERIESLLASGQLTQQQLDEINNHIGVIKAHGTFLDIAGDKYSDPNKAWATQLGFDYTQMFKEYTAEGITGEDKEAIYDKISSKQHDIDRGIQNIFKRFFNEFKLDVTNAMNGDFEGSDNFLTNMVLNIFGPFLSSLGFDIPENEQQAGGSPAQDGLNTVLMAEEPLSVAEQLEGQFGPGDSISVDMMNNAQYQLVANLFTHYGLPNALEDGLSYQDIEALRATGALTGGAPGSDNENALNILANALGTNIVLDPPLGDMPMFIAEPLQYDLIGYDSNNTPYYEANQNSYDDVMPPHVYIPDGVLEIGVLINGGDRTPGVPGLDPTIARPTDLSLVPSGVSDDVDAATEALIATYVEPVIELSDRITEAFESGETITVLGDAYPENGLVQFRIGTPDDGVVVEFPIPLSEEQYQEFVAMTNEWNQAIIDGAGLPDLDEMRAEMAGIFNLDGELEDMSFNDALEVLSGAEIDEVDADIPEHGLREDDYVPGEETDTPNLPGH